MINLLPPLYSDRIRYGRRNTFLRRWVIAALLAVAGLSVITVSGWLYIDQQTKDLQRDINHSKQQLEAQSLDEVQKNAKEISEDVKIINQVLSREIRFSGLIQDIGKVMPTGTVLSSLTLSKVNGALDLSANAKSYASAAQIAVNLNDPKNMLFDKVDIIGVNCSSDNDESQYKCNVTLKALFSKSAQNRYINIAKEDS